MTKLRIEVYYKMIEFDVYHAIMDANLGNYADIVLLLLKEGYGFKSVSENNKYRVVKYRTTFKDTELLNELEEGLNLIFRLLKEFKLEITR